MSTVKMSSLKKIRKGQLTAIQKFHSQIHIQRVPEKYQIASTLSIISTKISKSFTLWTTWDHLKETMMWKDFCTAGVNKKVHHQSKTYFCLDKVTRIFSLCRDSSSQQTALTQSWWLARRALATQIMSMTSGNSDTLYYFKSRQLYYLS